MEIIDSEDFDLTPAIKSAIEEKARKIYELIGKDQKIEVFLSKEGSSETKVVFRTHYLGHTVSAEVIGPDFYHIVNDVKAKMIRQIADLKDKKSKHH
ncbi:MAG: HPF/RaiA family ribosome-associated protein [Bdellovibrionales bacterium]|nr:HPF/RaiA family ribosome-associated protein [Bdellovibrionales bacterium]